MSEDRAIQMLETGLVAFSQARAFNDPTEMSAAGYEGEDTTMTSGLPRSFLLNQSYGIFCMTRTPLNPIMWAHYGDSHRGIVLGIDTALADLDSPTKCVLPARYGSVIYTSSKPVHHYELSEEQVVREGGIHAFDSQYLEALQRMFLHKSTEWAYEEEVRIVRSTTQLNEERCRYVSRLDAPGWAGTYLSKIPIAAIQSAHIGWLAAKQTPEATADLFVRIKNAQPTVDLYETAFRKNSWRMKQEIIIDWKDTVAQWHPSRDVNI